MTTLADRTVTTKNDFAHTIAPVNGGNGFLWTVWLSFPNRAALFVADGFAKTRFAAAVQARESIDEAVASQHD